MAASEFEQRVAAKIIEKRKMLSELRAQFEKECGAENVVVSISPARKKRTQEKKLIERKIMPMRAAKSLYLSANIRTQFEHTSISFEENEGLETLRKKRKIYAPRYATAPSDRVILSPDEITEEALQNVADTVLCKKVCKGLGTTCHQCRQKTMDTKSHCRNKLCIGIRGQFCGPCLRNRYGEDVRVVLKDAEWHCPPCRDICNCSFCRTNAGLPVTGICIPTAKRLGYRSVREYLQSCEDDVTDG